MPATRSWGHRVGLLPEESRASEPTIPALRSRTFAEQPRRSTEVGPAASLAAASLERLAQGDGEPRGGPGRRHRARVGGQAEEPTSRKARTRSPASLVGPVHPTVP